MLYYTNLTDRVKSKFMLKNSKKNQDRAKDVCVRQRAVSNMKSTTRNREHPLMISCCVQRPCLRTAPSSRRLLDRILSGLELETFKNLTVVLEPLDVRDIEFFSSSKIPSCVLGAPEWKWDSIQPGKELRNSSEQSCRL